MKFNLLNQVQIYRKLKLKLNLIFNFKFKFIIFKNIVYG